MTFISYAQNFEDIILNRVFKDITEGFYIDVGAYSPIEHSITKALYDRGWHGINIEPVKKYFDEFTKDRPRDINLNIAVSSEEKEFIFYEIPETGLSTLNKEIAEAHSGKWKIEQHQLKTKTLNQIIEQYLTPKQEIFFLKIDVEGHEKKVLEGINLVQFRPWLFIIEATRPMTQDLCFEEWEPILLDANYSFIYFDGLNRFYLAKEHAALKTHFLSPLNVFDDFIKVDYLTELQKKHSIINVLNQDKQNLNVQLEQANQEKQNLKIHLEQITLEKMTISEQLINLLNSKSWKITKPLRKIMLLFKKRS